MASPPPPPPQSVDVFRRRLVDTLECVVCSELCRPVRGPGVPQCSNGHLHCMSCFISLDAPKTCVACRDGGVGKIFSSLANNVAALLPHGCRNGCVEWKAASISATLVHETQCTERTVVCPNLCARYCSVAYGRIQKLKLVDLKQHLQVECTGPKIGKCFTRIAEGKKVVVKLKWPDPALVFFSLKNTEKTKFVIKVGQPRELSQFVRVVCYALLCPNDASYFKIYVKISQMGGNMFWSCAGMCHSIDRVADGTGTTLNIPKKQLKTTEGSCFTLSFSVKRTEWCPEIEARRRPVEETASLFDQEQTLLKNSVSYGGV